MTARANGSAHRVQAVDRAIDLWKAIAAAPAPRTARELAASCGMNRSTAWRILRTLEERGIVERDPLTQRYELGYVVVQAANLAGHDALARRARPTLLELADETRESVSLAIAERFWLVYVDQVDPPNAVAPRWLDKHVPLHATSGGKVFLAWLPPDEMGAVMPTHLDRYTPTTITDHDALARELERVQRAGYAMCIGEYEEFSNGVSAPVFDQRGRPQAVVNVWGPSARLTRRRLQELGLRTKDAAATIARLLWPDDAARESGGSVPARSALDGSR